MLIDKISQSYLFKDLTDNEKTLLNQILHEEKIEQGTVIFRVDQPPSFLYFVVEGELLLTFPDKNQIGIGPKEFIGEIGILNGSFRLGELFAVKASTVVKMCGTSLFDDKLIPPALALLLIRRMGESVTSYFKTLQNTSSKELISRGESEAIEFKSSLRWNYKANKIDKAIELASIKTIAALLNSNGGNLFIGVNDEGKILGLTKDQFPNEDKMLLHLTSLIKAKISPNHLQFISLQIETLVDLQYLRIDCTKSLFPAFVTHNEKEMFYIRTGPSTTNLKISEAIKYISENFSRDHY